MKRSIFQRFEVKLKCKLFIALEKIMAPAPARFERGSRQNEILQTACSPSELAGPGHLLFIFKTIFDEISSFQPKWKIKLYEVSNICTVRFI